MVFHNRMITLLEIYVNIQFQYYENKKPSPNNTINMEKAEKDKNNNASVTLLVRDLG